MAPKKWIPICLVILLIMMDRSVWGQLTAVQLAELAYEKGQQLEHVRDFQKAAEYYLDNVKVGTPLHLGLLTFRVLNSDSHPFTSWQLIGLN